MTYVATVELYDLVTFATSPTEGEMQAFVRFKDQTGTEITDPEILSTMVRAHIQYSTTNTEGDPAQYGSPEGQAQKGLKMFTLKYQNFVRKSVTIPALVSPQGGEYALILVAQNIGAAAAACDAVPVTRSCSSEDQAGGPQQIMVAGLADTPKFMSAVSSDSALVLAFRACSDEGKDFPATSREIIISAGGPEYNDAGSAAATNGTLPVITDANRHTYITLYRLREFRYNYDNASSYGVLQDSVAVAAAAQEPNPETLTVLSTGNGIPTEYGGTGETDSSLAAVAEQAQLRGGAAYVKNAAGNHEAYYFVRVADDSYDTPALVAAAVSLSHTAGLHSGQVKRFVLNQDYSVGNDLDSVWAKFLTEYAMHNTDDDGIRSLPSNSRYEAGDALPSQFVTPLVSVGTAGINSTEGGDNKPLGAGASGKIKLDAGRPVEWTSAVKDYACKLYYKYYDDLDTTAVSVAGVNGGVALSEKDLFTFGTGQFRQKEVAFADLIKLRVARAGAEAATNYLQVTQTTNGLAGWKQFDPTAVNGDAGVDKQTDAVWTKDLTDSGGKILNDNGIDFVEGKVCCFAIQAVALNDANDEELSPSDKTADVIMTAAVSAPPAIGTLTPNVHKALDPQDTNGVGFSYVNGSHPWTLKGNALGPITGIDVSVGINGGAQSLRHHYEVGHNSVLGGMNDISAAGGNVSLTLKSGDYSTEINAFALEQGDVLEVKIALCTLEYPSNTADLNFCNIASTTPTDSPALVDMGTTMSQDIDTAASAANYPNGKGTVTCEYLLPEGPFSAGVLSDVAYGALVSSLGPNHETLPLLTLELTNVANTLKVGDVLKMDNGTDPAELVTVTQVHAPPPHNGFANQMAVWFTPDLVYNYPGFENGVNDQDVLVTEMVGAAAAAWLDGNGTGMNNAVSKRAQIRISSADGNTVLDYVDATAYVGAGTTNLNLGRTIKNFPSLLDGIEYQYHIGMWSDTYKITDTIWPAAGAGTPIITDSDGVADGDSNMLWLDAGIATTIKKPEAPDSASSPGGELRQVTISVVEAGGTSATKAEQLLGAGGAKVSSFIIAQVVTGNTISHGTTVFTIFTGTGSVNSGGVGGDDSGGATLNASNPKETHTFVITGLADDLNREYFVACANAANDGASLANKLLLNYTSAGQVRTRELPEAMAMNHAASNQVLKSLHTIVLPAGVTGTNGGLGGAPDDAASANGWILRVLYQTYTPDGTAADSIFILGNAQTEVNFDLDGVGTADIHTYPTGGVAPGQTIKVWIGGGVQVDNPALTEGTNYRSISVLVNSDLDTNDGYANANYNWSSVATFDTAEAAGSADYNVTGFTISQVEDQAKMTASWTAPSGGADYTFVGYELYGGAMATTYSGVKANQTLKTLWASTSSTDTSVTFAAGSNYTAWGTANALTQGDSVGTMSTMPVGGNAVGLFDQSLPIHGVTYQFKVRNHWSIVTDGVVSYMSNDSPAVQILLTKRPEIVSITTIATNRLKLHIDSGGSQIIGLVAIHGGTSSDGGANSLHYDDTQSNDILMVATEDNGGVDNHLTNNFDYWLPTSSTLAISGDAQDFIIAICNTNGMTLYSVDNIGGLADDTLINASTASPTLELLN